MEIMTVSCGYFFGMRSTEKYIGSWHHEQKFENYYIHYRGNTLVRYIGEF